MRMNHAEEKIQSTWFEHAKTIIDDTGDTAYLEQNRTIEDTILPAISVSTLIKEKS